jgi:tRNA(fMet)-specific endonuclease VapC
MAVLYDTNILLPLARDPSSQESIRRLVNPYQEQEFISIVNAAELRSLGYQNQWGPTKLANIDTLLSSLLVINIDAPAQIDRYVEIDVFSRRKHATRKMETSARKMSKNDLWIATTCSLFNLRLITADGDFDHLNGKFLKLSKFTPEALIGG